MLKELINNLTTEQEAELVKRKIRSPLISSWRTGRRRPTYAQCVYLAEVTGADVKNLLLEMALNEVPPETAEKFVKLLKN